MSIILIDDILFNDSLEERTIRYNNCIFFLILNGASIFFGLLYLYFYFMIPNYNNSSNSLALFFSIFHLISNSFYFLIFFELYLYEPGLLSVTIKIITMFNPLIILCIYFWSACLTHNLYVTYYNYTHNMDKRFKFYKYLLFIIIIIFYIYTLLNIHFNDSQLLSKKFTFISNYTISFLDIFYSFGFFTILFILYKLYFILNKKADFIVSEYQETKERSKRLKNIFSSVVSRNIAYICYFLLTFIPANAIMILKYVFGKNNIQSYFCDFSTISLISFFGSFLFLVKLFDPLMRNFIINLLLFNRNYIQFNSSMSTVPLISEEENGQEAININKKNKKFYSNNTNNKNIDKISSVSAARNKTKSDGNISIYRAKFSKPIKKICYCSEPNSDDCFEPKNYYEMKILNITDNNISNSIQYDEEYYSDNYSNENEKKNENKNNSFTSADKLSVNQNKKINKEMDYKNGQSNILKSLKNRIHSFGKNEIIKREFLSAENPNERNNTICLMKALNPKMMERAQKSLLLKKYKIYKIFPTKKKSGPSRSSMHIRSNSIKNNILKRKSIPPSQVKGSRSITKSRIDFCREEITSFASMNYHLEVNENLLRMIAISISVNECRKYDTEEKYKKYYKLTVPWPDKRIYLEKTKNKEYTEYNMPTWLGIKGEAKFTNIQFKIMSYCPFVFHHIRLMDKLSIDEILKSLDPIQNMKKIKEMKVLGGRGNNSLFCTWDKKIILKTIDRNEKRILFDKMIKDYHCFMREQRSLLSRIYGLYKIELIDKGSIYVIVQKNMDDLPFDTKLLSFDFKGSTVDRQVILKGDYNLKKEILWLKYKNKVLKDKDLNLIGIKFILDYQNWRNIINYIDSDSSFLQNLGITDYSLIVFVHKFKKEEMNNCKGSNRIIESKDRNYIFNFSIVDYLGTYNFMKKGEKFIKHYIGYIKKDKDTNFSVLDPINYADRFRKFCKKIIKDE